MWTSTQRGANNGTSWQDAFTTLQPALEAAATDDEIWVAEGTYKPKAQHGGTGDRYKSFQLKNGVALYGGFAGTEASRDERNWVLHETILSGDLNGDDRPGFANNSDNSYHVFYHPVGTDLDSSAILDGFTISDGNADQIPPDDRGGGMYNNYSSPALSNCIFAGNSASNYGAGMYNNVGAPMLTDCTFSGNSAHYYAGGMYNDYSSPVLTNCTFEGNSAGYNGGGMINFGGAPVLTNCTFSGNSASNYGGGILNQNSLAALTNCTFSGNSAGSVGGGMHNFGSESPRLTDCTFSGNSAGTVGGGMYNYGAPMLTNCTFWGNSAVHEGGGMYNGGISSPTLTNSILWGDTPDQISNSSGSAIVTYSDIQGGWLGEGNIDLDPLFVEPGNGDFHLGLGSPCIDAGDNAAPGLPDYDFEGDPRIIDGDGDGTATVDMGVDEARIRVYLPLVLRGY
jgi:predicted outer membrane repeat protein